MSKRVRLGKAVSYNLGDCTVTYRYPFLDVDHIEDIESEIASANLCKIIIESTSHEEDSMNYEQQKKFFAMLTDILRHEKEPTNAITIREMYEDFQESYFPAKQTRLKIESVLNKETGKYEVVKKMVPRLRSITSLSKRELARVISRIHQNYDDLGIKWSRE